MLSIYTLPVTPFEQNARIITCQKSRETAVIDPGGEAQRIFAALREHSLECGQIWLTHSHLDHCGGVKSLKSLTGARLYAHAGEGFFRSNLADMCLMFGVPPHEMENCPEPDEPLAGGEKLELGEHVFEVISTPGHSVGGLSFYDAPSKILLAGDVLFAGSIGRTDLPGGDLETLRRSIDELMKRLPPDTRVLCGHGPDTTLQEEKRSNPFLNGDFI